LLLALPIRLPAKVKSQHSPLIVFGQTPLFFYLAHFYLVGHLRICFLKSLCACSKAQAIGIGERAPLASTY
jgi:hypothetical protein